MNKLFPIANKTTRHLFVDPALARPSFISGEGYVSGEMTSFIKPGKVPNLALLCQPEDVKFTVTEEPSVDTMKVTDILFGAFNSDNQWTVCLLREVKAQLAKDGPARSVLDGHVVINPDHNSVVDGITGEPVNLGDEPVMIPIDLLYERGTRGLTLKPVEGVGIDTGKPQILGIKLDLDWIDSKSV
ncbi:hypothetical protein pETSU_088 [Edwardsiella phage pEt-SU]|uniref:Uncharacterized protein n=1 Tax=Edwardsiella phage pEt-SU TaxID=2562142 RepID=A0A4D6DYB7_9CAUD|nr:hypothetical protein HOV39_gp088 [Edwardsiella phage pEt-SU]QBZ70669.1 hypothetical protein pETSU_088 [Edwardsiella phage pEt-SU]